jgi:hypothetical protein
LGWAGRCVSACAAPSPCHWPRWPRTDLTRILSDKAAAAWQLLSRRLARYLNARATSDRAWGHAFLPGPAHGRGSDQPAAAWHVQRPTSGYRQLRRARWRLTRARRAGTGRWQRAPHVVRRGPCMRAVRRAGRVGGTAGGTPHVGGSHIYSLSNGRGAQAAAGELPEGAPRRACAPCDRRYFVGQCFRLIAFTGNRPGLPLFAASVCPREARAHGLMPSIL